MSSNKEECSEKVRKPKVEAAKWLSVKRTTLASGDNDF
jgi:hypothetical protein